jgi:hypothetical protein
MPKEPNLQAVRFIKLINYRRHETTENQPVGAGSHTVSQELGQYLGAPAEFFYNQNELSVMFVPGSQASVISAAAAATASDRMTPTGQKR